MEAKATEESFETPFGDGEGILRILKDLSPQYQRVLRLFYLEQRPYQEIASLLGVPMGTVKTHLKRARLEMLKRLGRQRAGKAKPPQETIRI